MRRRLLLVLASLALLLPAGGAAGLYAYDRRHEDRIAAGVTVEGVPIGGLRVSAARARLARRLVPRYERPLVFVYGGRRFVLRPRSVGLRIDIAGALRTALAQSRRGSFLDRVYRSARGRPLDLSLSVGTRYSPAKVAVFIHRVGRAVARRPRGARFVPSLLRPRLVPGLTGVSLRSHVLIAAVRSRLVDPTQRRWVRLPTHTLVPHPTTAGLARSHRYFITVSRGERRLRLFVRLKLVKTYLIAVGQAGLETPAGVYRINDKQVDPSWHVPNSPWAGSLAGMVIPPGPADPLKARWLGFYNGAGIHGTDAVYSLGTAASHGCIRMSIPDVIELYDIVPVGTSLYIS
jgi:hypothetical protein